MRKFRLLFLPTVLAVGACTEATVEPSSPVVESLAAAPGDVVAKGIALAMQNGSIRVAIRDDMRASPMSEHKILLQDYFTGERREPLLDAIESAGIPRREFLRSLEALPPIQFYLPARQHRLTWRGAEDVLVSPNLEHSAPVRAYSPSGSTVPLRIADGQLPAAALFVLQRAEPMHHRVWSQASTPGQVIQDANDRDFGGAQIYRDAFGHVVRTVEFADLRSRHIAYECGPEVFVCDDVVSGGLSPGLYVTRLVNHGVCDNLCIWETLEFEFRSTSQTNGNLQVSEQLTGIEQYYDWSGTFIITSQRPWNQWVEVGVWETDGTSSDDLFECFEYGVTFNACVNWIPRIQVSPGGTMSFALCQGLPWTCAHEPSDIEVSFRDQP